MLVGIGDLRPTLDPVKLVGVDVPVDQVSVEIIVSDNAALLGVIVEKDILIRLYCRQIYLLIDEVWIDSIERYVHWSWRFIVTHFNFSLRSLAIRLVDLSDKNISIWPEERSHKKAEFRPAPPAEGQTLHRFNKQCQGLHQEYILQIFALR